MRFHGEEAVYAGVCLENCAEEFAQEAQEVLGTLLKEIATSAKYEREPQIQIDDEWSDELADDDELAVDINFDPVTPEIGYVAARLAALAEHIHEALYYLGSLNNAFAHTLKHEGVEL